VPTTKNRLVPSGLLLVAAAALAATALVTDDARPSEDPPRVPPATAVVCDAYATLSPVASIAPYGEVHLVDGREAAELERGCAHAGLYELTPSCALWRTEPVPERVAVLAHEHCGLSGSTR
jgi:hypothetical protein